MSVPSYLDLMLPILKLLDQKGFACSYQEQMEHLAIYFNLSDEDLKETISSGQSRLYDRTTWANSYMLHAGLIQRYKKGKYSITETGRELLAQNPAKITLSLLQNYPSFVEFLNYSPTTRSKPKQQISIDNCEKTPDELLESAYQEIVRQTKSDILDKIKSCSPRFFEHLVIDLLVSMGYGGSREDCAEVVGGSGDGGIDGVIKEDRLGLDVIYIQAKRYNNPVQSKDIRDFVGALHFKNATKGVFITTSTFPANVHQQIASGMRIVLIDGPRLAELMMEYSIGVETKRLFKIHRINNDYFEEENEY
ncbi:MAG: restriction endonuclease [Thermoguttaceae bacterium]